MKDKKKPQDATMRNIRTSRKIDAKLEKRIKALEEIVDKHQKYFLEVYTFCMNFIYKVK